jgi:ABC-type glycerol-3-phosphate transport system permease component
LKRKKRFQAIGLLSYLLLSSGAAAMVLPFVWMLSTSLKAKKLLNLYPPQWIPNPAAWENYPKAIGSFPFFQYLWNNIKITSLILLGTLCTSALAGYAFSRMRFRFRDPLFIVILAVMMIPGQVTMIPVFLLIRDLGMIDTHSALVIPSLVSPFGIFILRQYFLTLPKDLEDAAYIDGCTPPRVFAQIMLPLAAPALAALTVLTFMGTWNSFIWPLLLISTKSKYMLTVGLLQFQNQYGNEYNLMMAATLLCLAPVMILYIFTQRYFVEGIAFSGIKG